MMQRKNGTMIWGLLGALALICAILLGGQSAQADIYSAVSGDGATVTTFYVQTSGTATITLTQQAGVFTSASATGGSARAWGRFHVDCTLNGTSQRVEWTPAVGSDTYTLQLRQVGTYTITVTPYTNAEMAQQITGFGQWKAVPTWSLTGIVNARVISTPVTQAPSAQNAYCTVYYRDTANKILSQRTQSCTLGANPITAPQNLQNGLYYLISPATQTVTLYANGTLSTQTVTFYYAQSPAVVTPTPTPVPVTVKSCTVHYRDLLGSLLSATSRTCSVGQNTITAPSTLTVGGKTYTRVSTGTQTVTMYSNGTLSASTVTFYYQLQSTPTPVPTTAKVNIYYRDSAGSLLQTRSETISVGTRSITAPSTITVSGRTYTLYTNQTQSVTLYANGTLSSSALTFYYKQQTASATVNIYYRDSTGSLLQSKTETVTEGTRSFTAPATLTVNGRTYKLYTNQTQSVTLYANGTLSASSLSFYYQQQTASANVTIYYRDSSGSLLQSKTETITEGTRSFTAPSTLTVGGRTYSLYTNQTQSVTLYANGTLSASSLSFYYQQQAVTGTVTIYYRDSMGNTLSTTSQTVSRGKNTITAPSAITVGGTTYTLIPPTSQQVTLNADGTMSANTVNFYYQKPSAPVTATLYVYYRDGAGNILQTRTETLTQGSRQISAPSAITVSGRTFNLTSSGSVTVTLYADGTLSHSSVDFYYKEYQQVSVTITIRQMDVDTNVTLSTRTETLGVGTHTVKAGSTPGGYELYSASSTTVTVYADGTASQKVINFGYRKKATTPPVTPVPVTPTEGQVIPASWDTQFKDGSASPRSISTLPRICDGDFGRSFYYTMWSSEKADDIPEITVVFNAEANVGTLAMANGDLSSNSNYYNKGRPKRLRVVIYSDEGVNTKTFDISNIWDKRLVPYSFGTVYHNVTKIEIFIPNITMGEKDRYEIHIAEMAFYDN